MARPRLIAAASAGLAACALVFQLGLGAQAPDIEQHINALIARMTLDEKFGQLQQLDGHADGRNREEHFDLVRKGLLGSTLNVRGAENVNALQKAALEESRLKIPVVFAFDVIHGYRTVFPIPLGETASWDPEAAERAAAIAAAESRAAGLQWTFAPMVDIARDARWGRIAEGAGEDPWLGSVFAAARVRGFQGTNMAAPDRIAATAKHWVAYGAAEGGRDYAATDMSEHALRSIYFPPFKAAVDAGVATFMSAFNDLNGVPTSSNPFTLTTVLREEWKWDGLVVSDYKSVVETINHGLARDEADAARQALPAGVDMEMISRTYVTHGPALVKAGEIPVPVVDEAVRRALRLKYRVGLFDRPYADPALEPATLLKPEFRAAARDIAARSMVLLEHDGRTLPIKEGNRRIALVGPFGDNRDEMMGNWTGDGRREDVVTLKEGLEAALPGAQVTVARGADLDVKMLWPGGAGDAAGAAALRDEAVAAAREADLVVLTLGESGAMSGEAASRTSLDLPPFQRELAEAIFALKKPTAVVLFTGRPLALGWLKAAAPAMLLAWFPGTEAGHAVADVLTGRVNPQGKLPVTFPRHVGQVPIYYSHKATGRPPAADDKYTSKYIDAEWTPLYPFGYGLSYTTFELSDLRVSAASIPATGSVTVSATVRNAGAVKGTEVVQFYVRDVAASVTRPVQELRGFTRVTLEPGESRRVEFTAGPKELGFLGRDLKWRVEPGEFRVRVSQSSEGGLTGAFEVR